MPGSRKKTVYFSLIAAWLACSPALAHRMWILPSSTVLSGMEAWVTFDAAISNTLFVFEHRPLRLDGLVVTGPGGRRLKPRNLHTGQYRSSFDLLLDAPGTYRISLAQSSVMASWRENGEPRRWRGAPEQLAAHVPAGAQQLVVSRFSARVETYVTLGRPSRDVLAPTGRGLEVIPETHPNDLIAGEEAVFVVVLDGRPAPGTPLTIVRGMGRHAESPWEKKLQAGADGRITVSFPAAGFYWLQAVAGDADSVEGGSRATCVVVVEVLPQ
jgi:hypothetical protein